MKKDNKNRKNGKKVIFKKYPRKFNKKRNIKNANKNHNFDNYYNNKNRNFFRDNYKYGKSKNLFYQPKKPFYSPFKINKQKKQKNIKSDIFKSNNEKHIVFEFDANKNQNTDINIFDLLFKGISKNQEKKKEIPEKEPEKREKFSINKEKNIDIIDHEINNISDIIKLGKLYENPDFKEKNYSVNIKALYKMTPALQELQSLVGLKNIKEKLTSQIKFFSQELHNEYNFEPKTEKKTGGFFGKNRKPLQSILYEKNKKCNEDNFDMMHTIIEGPPGVGKTIFAKILARIYLSLGISRKNNFKVVRRSDLVGEYLGHTARLTEKAIEEALGGVLFIDEAYSLGNGNGKKIDSYSKECIDTINQALTERKGQFICIIAGYKEELEKSFFSVNPGLKRRFSFKYSIDKYSWQELSEILIQKINNIQWIIDDNTKKWIISSEFLKNKMEYFPHFGGDIETLLLHIKIEHASRVFGKHYNLHKNINQIDIENGFEKYMMKRKKKEDSILYGMYV